MAAPMHRNAPGHRLFYIHEGTGRVLLGDRTVPTRPGDASYAPGGPAPVEHGLINESRDTPLLYVAIGSNMPGQRGYGRGRGAKRGAGTLWPTCTLDKAHTRRAAFRTVIELRVSYLMIFTFEVLPYLRWAGSRRSKLMRPSKYTVNRSDSPGLSSFFRLAADWPSGATAL